TVGSSSGFASSAATPVKLIGGQQTPSALVVKLNNNQFAGVVKSWDGSALTDQAGLRFTSSDNTVVYYTGTNEHGEFKVGALPTTGANDAPLTYSVYASPPYKTAGVPAPIVSGVVPSSPAAFNLVLTLGTPIVRGKVVMPAGSPPVADAELTLVGPTGERTYGST